MNLSHVQIGDQIAVRNGKWHDEPRYELATVTKIGKSHVSISDGRSFSIKTGDVLMSTSTLSADIVPSTDDILAKIGAA